MHPATTEREAPLTITIIVTYAHPYIGSGLGVVAKAQAEALAAQGHHVTLISSNIPRAAKNFVLNGVTHVKVPALALLERLHVPVPLLFFNIRAIRAIKYAGIVHVHDILYPSSFCAALLAKFYKKRVVITQHVPHVHYTNKLINTLETMTFCSLGLLTLLLGDAVLVLNASVYRWIKYYKDAVFYLPNGVDLKIFTRPVGQEKQSIRERYQIPLNSFMALYVGRFVPKKGFDILYQAQDPAYLLAFVGGGSIPSYIKNDAKVKVFGPLPQEALAQMYKASDVFVLPSYDEGFPLSIQEAMATGLPIITSKENCSSPLLDSPFVLPVERTATDIQSAIKRVQADEQLRTDMSDYAYRVARPHYSWERNTVQLVEIYCNQQPSMPLPGQKRIVVTTSWDDGHKLDVRLAELLKKYGIQGTFYVCPQDRELKPTELLSRQEILSISQDFEIGGHTIMHPHLTKIPLPQAASEIAQSKTYLEDLLQKEVTAFCYPYGDYNAAVKALVAQCGYTLARTTQRYAFDVSTDPFALPTTFHTYAHYSDLHKILAFARFSPHRAKQLWDWECLAIALFEYVCETGGIFHLWGHSWEIEKYHGWQRLEHVLAYIASKRGILHQTNTELLQVAPTREREGSLL